MTDMPGEIRDTPGLRPTAYFITFTCYGTRLHGDQNGTVDGLHNQPNTPYLPPVSRRVAAREGQLRQPAFLLGDAHRVVVLRTIQEVCDYRKWTLFAVHVRTNHVHVVIHADVEPEKVLNDLKIYSSRRLAEAGLDGTDRRRWARHGSTRYLWTVDAVESAVQYTLHEQGEKMAAYPTPSQPRR